MLNKNIVLFILMLFCITAENIYAQTSPFPYFNSFKTSDPGDITFGGAPTAFLTSGTIDPAGDGYLRLTNNTVNQKGFIHNNTSFSSQNGLKIQFEYFTYGGSADGIAFFLYDASVSNFSIGGFGGSLGYAQYLGWNQSVVAPGVSGGYLGVGIDEYGNFSRGIEARQGGIEGPLDGLSPSSITLRGKGSGNSTDPENYKYLTSKSTRDFGFDIISSDRSAASSSINYRKAIIDLIPNPLGGYNITVKIVQGGTPVKTHTIINNYHYPEKAPDFVRYGITGSTGDAVNYHEIRNISINEALNTAPVAVDDNTTTPKNTAVSIPVLTNDTDINGNATIKKSSVTIESKTAGATITVDPLTGVVRYTPPLNFVGKDTFFYNIKDEHDEVSNNAEVTVLVSSTKPVGVNDNARTTVNKPIDISVLSNDPSRTDNVTVISTGPTAQGGSLAVNSDGSIKYIPAAGFVGTDIFTYKLRTVDGLESDVITVTVVIQIPPIANNDSESTFMDVPVEINLAGNDTDSDGIVNKSSIVIKSFPANGTLSSPDALGNITYTPQLRFVGTDSFTYTIKDNEGIESLPATVNIAITSIPLIGISKALTSINNSINGTFTVHFTFTVGNYAKETLRKVSIKDDLAAAFTGATYQIISVNATGALKVNPNFNGAGDIELLDPISTLLEGEIQTVDLIVNIALVSREGSFENNAFAEGESTLTGKKATDQSVSGGKPDPFVTGDISPFGPTFFHLTKGPLYIPEGFSPNNDGINDFFVISNSLGSIIELDVFNRWGNRVHKSQAYKNDWDGRCTEGISIGQDLPGGTYYYIIIIDKKDKHVGYITISR